MSNMSYCRFRNTLKDLSDCQNALEGFFANDSGNDVSLNDSREEFRAAKALVQCCLDIAQLVAEQSGADLNDDGAVELLESNLDEIFASAAAIAKAKPDPIMLRKQAD